MEQQFNARYVRVAPRKMRIVMKLVRGKTAGEALEMLKFVTKGAALPIAKVIEAGVEAIRKKDPTINVDELVLKRGWINQGPAMKRRRPRARGYATMIKKLFSHVGVVLSDEK